MLFIINIFLIFNNGIFIATEDYVDNKIKKINDDLNNNNENKTKMIKSEDIKKLIKEKNLVNKNGDNSWTEYEGAVINYHDHTVIFDWNNKEDDILIHKLKLPQDRTLSNVIINLKSCVKEKEYENYKYYFNDGTSMYIEFESLYNGPGVCLTYCYSGYQNSNVYFDEDSEGNLIGGIFYLKDNLDLSIINDDNVLTSSAAIIMNEFQQTINESINDIKISNSIDLLKDYTRNLNNKWNVEKFNLKNYNQKCENIIIHKELIKLNELYNISFGISIFPPCCSYYYSEKKYDIEYFYDGNNNLKEYIFDDLYKVTLDPTFNNSKSIQLTIERINNNKVTDDTNQDNKPERICFRDGNVEISRIMRIDELEKKINVDYIRNNITVLFNNDKNFYDYNNTINNRLEKLEDFHNKLNVSSVNFWLYRDFMNVETNRVLAYHFNNDTISLNDFVIIKGRFTDEYTKSNECDKSLFMFVNCSSYFNYEGGSNPDAFDKAITVNYFDNEKYKLAFGLDLFITKPQVHQKDEGVISLIRTKIDSSKPNPNFSKDDVKCIIEKVYKIPKDLDQGIKTIFDELQKHINNLENRILYLEEKFKEL